MPKNSVEDFQKADSRLRKSINNRVSLPRRWESPPTGKIKINQNADVDKNKKMGVGIIARDHERKVMASMCTTKPYIFDPEVTDWKGVEFSRDMRFQNIMME